MRSCYHQNVRAHRRLIDGPGHGAAGRGRDGREDDCGSLENCCTGNRTVGSNPTPSAIHYHLIVAVRSVRTPGRYFAGDTLYLMIRPSGEVLDTAAPSGASPLACYGEVSVY